MARRLCISGCEFAVREHWGVRGVDQVEGMFGAFAELLSESGECCMFFEGAYSGSPELVAFFEKHATEADVLPPRGTLGWHEPYCVHASEDALAELDALADSHAGTELCYHLNVLRGAEWLVSWYDAFLTDEMLVSFSVPEARVASFCARIRAGYCRKTPPPPKRPLWRRCRDAFRGLRRLFTVRRRQRHEPE